MAVVPELSHVASSVPRASEPAPWIMLRVT